MGEGKKTKKRAAPGHLKQVLQVTRCRWQHVLIKEDSPLSLDRVSTSAVRRSSGLAFGSLEWGKK